jgi:hypothetical protein
MASFPDLRHRNPSSDSTEGSRVFGIFAVATALLHAAVAAFLTVSELATLHGAAKATPAIPTRSPDALSNAGHLVGKPFLNHESRVAA